MKGWLFDQKIRKAQGKPLIGFSQRGNLVEAATANRLRSESIGVR